MSVAPLTVHASILWRALSCRENETYLTRFGNTTTNELPISRLGTNSRYTWGRQLEDTLLDRTSQCTPDFEPFGCSPRLYPVASPRWHLESPSVNVDLYLRPYGCAQTEFVGLREPYPSLLPAPVRPLLWPWRAYSIALLQRDELLRG